jgi:hypothetical protein
LPPPPLYKPSFSNFDPVEISYKEKGDLGSFAVNLLQLLKEVRNIRMARREFRERTSKLFIHKRYLFPLDFHDFASSLLRFTFIIGALADRRTRKGG